MNNIPKPNRTVVATRGESLAIMADDCGNDRG